MLSMTTGRKTVGTEPRSQAAEACAIIAPPPHRQGRKKFRAVGALQVRLVRPASAAADREIRVEGGEASVLEDLAVDRDCHSGKVGPIIKAVKVLLNQGPRWMEKEFPPSVRCDPVHSR
jgi:hypothetical protein